MDSAENEYDQVVVACHERLKQASEDAVELIQNYAAADPLAEGSPWQQPQEILDALQRSRTAIQDAWKQYQEALQQNFDEEKETKTLSDEEFRILYMDMITDAFGDVLENMRTGNDKMDVDVLVDCLQSGMEILEDNDRTQDFLDSMTEMPSMEDDEDDVPVHQRMQEALGLRSPVQSSSEA
jgi:hypothetical protein